MKIDVRKCNAEHKYSGDLVFSTEGDNSLIDIPYVTFSSPLEWAVHFDILEDDTVEVRGRVAFSLKGMCSRCLSETEQRFFGESESCFSPKEGEEDYFYKGGVVDLSEYLRDSVLDALPRALFCGETCVPPEYKE